MGGGYRPRSAYLGRGHGHVVELALAALRDGSDEEEGPAVLGESRLFILRATETGQSRGGPRHVCGGQTGLRAPVGAVCVIANQRRSGKGDR